MKVIPVTETFLQADCYSTKGQSEQHTFSKQLNWVTFAKSNNSKEKSYGTMLENILNVIEIFPASSKIIGKGKKLDLPRSDLQHRRHPFIRLASTMVDSWLCSKRAVVQESAYFLTKSAISSSFRGGQNQRMSWSWKDDSHLYKFNDPMPLLRANINKSLLQDLLMPFNLQIKSDWNKTFVYRWDANQK